MAEKIFILFIIIFFINTGYAQTPQQAVPQLSLQPGDYLYSSFKQVFFSELQKTHSPFASLKEYDRRIKNKSLLNEIYFTQEPEGLMFHGVLSYHEGGYESIVNKDGTIPRPELRYQDPRPEYEEPIKISIEDENSFIILHPAEYAGRYERIGDAGWIVIENGYDYHLAFDNLVRLYTIAGKYVDAKLQEYQIHSNGKANFAGIEYKCFIDLDDGGGAIDHMICSAPESSNHSINYHEWKFKADADSLKLYELLENEDEDDDSLKFAKKPFLVLKRLPD